MISAITAGLPAAIFARSAPAKSRGATAARARRSISASGTLARAASISARLVARMRRRMSATSPCLRPWP
jgi:hypothetical protein